MVTIVAPGQGFSSRDPSKEKETIPGLAAREKEKKKSRRSGGSSRPSVSSKSLPSITSPISIDPIKAASTGRGSLTSQSSFQFGTSASSSEARQARSSVKSLGTPVIRQSEREAGVVGFVPTSRRQAFDRLDPIIQADPRKAGLPETRASRIFNVANILEREREIKIKSELFSKAEKQIREGKDPSVKGLTFQTKEEGFSATIDPSAFKDVRSKAIVESRQQFSSLPAGKKAGLITGDIFQGATKFSRGVSEFQAKTLISGLGGKLKPVVDELGKTTGFEKPFKDLFKSGIKDAPEAPISKGFLESPTQFLKEVLTDPSVLTQVSAGVSLGAFGLKRLGTSIKSSGLKETLIETSKALSPTTVKEGIFRIPTKDLQFTGEVTKTAKGELIKGVDIRNVATIKGASRIGGKQVEGLFEISQPIIRVSGGGSQVDIGSARTFVRTTSPRIDPTSSIKGITPVSLGGKQSQLISPFKGQAKISGVTTEASLDIVRAGKFSSVRLETGIKPFEPLSTTVTKQDIIFSGVSKPTTPGKFKLSKQDISFLGKVKTIPKTKGAKGISFGGGRATSLKVQETTLGLPSFKSIPQVSAIVKTPSIVAFPLLSKQETISDISKSVSIGVNKFKPFSKKDIFDIGVSRSVSSSLISKKATRQKSLQSSLQKQTTFSIQDLSLKQLTKTQIKTKGKQVSELQLSIEQPSLGLGIGIPAQFSTGGLGIILPKDGRKTSKVIKKKIVKKKGKRLGPSFTGIVTGIKSDLPKELSIGGISPFELRGI